MFWSVISMLILGLIAGAIARLLVPGRDPIGFLGTILIGVIGSFVGGFLGYLIFHHDKSQGWVQPSSWIGSIVGAVIVLLVYRKVGGSNRSARI